MSRRPKQQALALRMQPIAPGERRPVEVIKVDRPTPDDLGPGDVLVRVKRVMVCRTDREIATTPGHGTPTRGCEPYARILHEAGGQILARGSEVPGTLQDGDWVSLLVRQGAGCPACEAGLPQRCYRWQEDITEFGIFHTPGFGCETVIVPHTHAVPLPPGLDPAYGSFGEPASIGGHALGRCWHIARGSQYPERWDQPERWNPPFWGLPWGARRKPVVLFLGAGGVALPSIPLFLREGFDCIVAAWTRRDPRALKQRLIDQLGARYVSLQDFIEIPDPDDRSRWNWHLDAMKRLVPEGFFDAVVDMCGDSETVLRALAQLHAPGTLFMLSSITAGSRPVSIDADRLLYDLVMNNAQIAGIVNAERLHFRLGLEGLKYACELHDDWPAQLLTHRFDNLEEMSRTFWDVLDDHRTIRAHLDFF
ncbi:MAG: alcohol dehydrogenase catalytic domain-containing protein [Candidatus Eisenbacteria sp.]|nr:alcohol dehydrogenase catalytic domain-containing protein [Candidatus Eisenbacteria bacterium]